MCDHRRLPIHLKFPDRWRLVPGRGQNQQPNVTRQDAVKMCRHHLLSFHVPTESGSPRSIMPILNFELFNVTTPLLNHDTAYLHDTPKIDRQPFSCRLAQCGIPPGFCIAIIGVPGRIAIAPLAGRGRGLIQCQIMFNRMVQRRNGKVFEPRAVPAGGQARHAVGIAMIYCPRQLLPIQIRRYRGSLTHQFQAMPGGPQPGNPPMR